MLHTRRGIIQSGAALAALGAMPKPLRAMLRQRPEAVPLAEDPNAKLLSATSLTAARGAGASYADVRLTHTYSRRIGDFPADEESMTFGVRVLVDGYWGFAASPVWTVDEAARLGRAAVRQARANMLGKPRTVDLAPIAQLSSGHWETPIRDDPFAISPDEIGDFFAALGLFMVGLPGVSPTGPGAEFIRQDKVFASTLGQFYTQRVYRTSARVSFSVQMNGRQMRVALESLTPAGAGFEYIRDQPLRDQIVQLYEETKEDLMIPLKPLDVGRYETIFDAQSVARIMSQTVGAATELDRAMGYEANAGGTSYITDPLGMVGTLKIGAPMITVTANRSEAGGVATVKWDDEGVEPKPITLVKDGILTDMQTTRESAGWLRPFYEKQRTAVASSGCAYASDAIFAPTTQCANLQLQTTAGTDTLASLIANVQHGMVFKGASVDMDFQQITGLVMGTAYEIKGGRRIAAIPTAGIIFRTPEFWSGITRVGSNESRRRYGIDAIKGQPAQTAYRSVTAAPVTVKEMTVVDITRKA